MRVFDNVREAYPIIANEVLRYGESSAPRGLETRELLGYQFRILNPRDALPTGVGRKPSLPFAAVEAAGLISGRNNVTTILQINPTMNRFMSFKSGQDGGEYMYQHGAYGPRVAPYLMNVVAKLTSDRDSRQAILTIWSPMKDWVNEPDIPCTLSLQFMIRNDKLHALGTMRSNDVWWGTAYDIFQFTQLQITIANALGIDVGAYTHTANSFHVYEHNFNDIESLRAPETAKPIGDYPVEAIGMKINTRVGDSVAAISSFQNRARVLLYEPITTVDLKGDLSASERWYREKLHYVSPRALSVTAIQAEDIP